MINIVLLKKVIPILLIIAILASCTQKPVENSSSVGDSVSSEEKVDPGSEDMSVLADKAYEDMLKNFWTGDETTGHISYENQGYVKNNLFHQKMLWAHAVMLFGMEARYKATGDESIHNRIVAEWEFCKENFSDESLVTPGQAPHLNHDDAGWDVMAYMIFYNHVKDPYILDITKRSLINCFNYFKDGDTKNGLWYSIDMKDKSTLVLKSISAVGLITAAFEYYEITKDKTVFDEAKGAYDWIEANLLRKGKVETPDFSYDCDDLLYFFDYNVNNVEHAAEKNGPAGWTRVNQIYEAGSVSGLFANMAMGVLHARLYKITGDEHYKTRAVETVHAITGSPFYNAKGVLVNDRDAWANGMYTGYWVEEVLTLDGVRQEDKDIIFATASSIAKNARTDDGYYGGSWSGPATGPKSKWWAAGSKPEQMMTSASSTDVIFGAQLLQKLSK